METTTVLQQARLPRFGLTTVAIGFVAGLINVLTGMGGGIVVVPGLVRFGAVDPRRAVTISLGTILVMSSVSMSIHLLVGGLAFSPAGLLVLAASGAAGAQVGSRLLFRLPRGRLLRVYSAFCVFCAAILLLKMSGLLPSALVSDAGAPVWIYPLTGLLSGLTSGLLGTGGALSTVLILTVFFHSPVLSVIPIALAMNLTNAASGLVAHARSGRLDAGVVGEVLRLVPASGLGITVGAAATVVLPPDLLRVVFSLVIVYVAFELRRKAQTA